MYQILHSSNPECLDEREAAIDQGFVDACNGRRISVFDNFPVCSTSCASLPSCDTPQGSHSVPQGLHTFGMLPPSTATISKVRTNGL